MLARSWPRAIAHIDGDAFFASVEQAVKPHLKGKPVVTGKERNIVAAASYEAKARGVKRGVTLWDAKKISLGRQKNVSRPDSTSDRLRNGQSFF